MGIDTSTEDKIKQAAKDIFIKKGFAATKTRDIAEQAGINLALVNYYFRSKENLFKLIMMESLVGLVGNIKGILTNPDTKLEEKLEILTARYIDQILEQPDLPMFILSELRTNPEEFVKTMSNILKFKETVIFHQLIEEIGMLRLMQLNPIHILINLMSMIIFPFIGKPLLLKITEMEENYFNTLMEERKKLIPLWIMQMLK
jgi:AcrR family transcriptional regulator